MALQKKKSVTEGKNSPFTISRFLMGLMTLSPSYCYAGEWREVCVVESACCKKIKLKATVWVQSFQFTGRNYIDAL